jgi:WD40 repeat protein
MRTAVAIALAGLGLAASGIFLLAHHSTANYDVTKVVAIKGTVTSVDWRNPHVHIHLDVTDADGRIVNWDVETWGIGQLSVRGLTNGFLKPRDQIRTEVFVEKDGSRRAVVHTLTLPDGRTIDGPPTDLTQ